MKKKENYAIKVCNVTKVFKLYYDKPNTLKERIVFWKKNKTEVHKVLDNINLEIDKGETVALIGTNGSGKSNELKPGTPAVPLIVSFSKALRLALTDLDKRENFVRRLNEKIVGEFQKLDGIILNQTKYSIPQILNISLKNIRPETLIHALEEYEIYVSTNTACASGELSTSIMAIYNDKKRAMSSIRISLSYITTTDEINRFLSYFKTIYHKLNELTD